MDEASSLSRDESLPNPQSDDRESGAVASQTDPEQWLERYGDYLFRYAMSRLRDADAAEEVVQETLVAALANVKQFAGRGSERGWLIGILKRKIVDTIRRRTRMRARGFDDGDDPADLLFDERGHWRREAWEKSELPSTAMENQEFWDALWECLEGVPQRQADAFTLRELEGVSTESICQELGVTPSHVWVLLYRARTRLAQCLKSRWQLGAE